MLTELIILLISYLGVFVGYGLSKIAKEEVKAGQKNLINLHRILLLMVLFAAFYNSPLSLTYQRWITIFACLVFLYFKSYYGMLGVLFGVNPSFIVASLIFLHGFPYGSLMFSDNYSKIIRKTRLFLIIGVIMMIIKTLLL